MTDTWRIGLAPYPAARPANGPKYKVGPLCAQPLCSRLADHAHHIWSRAFLGKASDWVEVLDPDGVGGDMCLLPNLLPLCWPHHEAVTGTVGGHRAGIRYDPESGCLYWVDGQGELELVWGTDTDAQPHVRAEPEFCPECGRRKLARRDTERLPKAAKRRKTRLVLTVPKDEREDGEAIARDALSRCAELIGRSENESYYTLVDVLNWFAWNYHPEAESYTGEGPCPTCGREEARANG